MLPDGRIVAVGASGQSPAVENLRFSGVVGRWRRRGQRAVAAPDRCLLLLRQRRPRTLRWARAVGRRGDGAQRPPGHGAHAHEPRGRARHLWDGDGTTLVRVHDGSVATDIALEPGGRAVAAGHASDGARHAFMLARFDAGGLLDRGFGGQGVVLTGFPGAAVARADRAGAPARRQARCRRASPARRAPARSARAGLRGSRWRAIRAATPPARRRPSCRRPTGRTPRRRPFVRLASRLDVRRGRVRIRVRCLQAARCRGRLSVRRLAKRTRGCSAPARSRSAPGARRRSP